jgi:hypothetical protein
MRWNKRLEGLRQLGNSATAREEEIAYQADEIHAARKEEIHEKS